MGNDESVLDWYVRKNREHHDRPRKLLQVPRRTCIFRPVPRKDYVPPKPAEGTPRERVNTSASDIAVTAAQQQGTVEKR